MQYQKMSLQEKKIALYHAMQSDTFSNYSEEEYKAMILDFAEICSKRCKKNFSVIIVNNNSGHSIDMQKAREMAEGRISKYESLPRDMVQMVNDLYADGYSKAEISRGLGISRNTVAKYLN